MIPKKIHYCWFGPNPPGDLNRRCIESWRRVLPDYEIKLWDEKNAPLDNAYARAAHAAGAWARLSNFARLHALYAEGGIYLDTDVEVLKDFSPLLRHECFAGFQQAEEQVDWVNSAVLGARAGHPFLARCLRLTHSLFASTGQLPRSPMVLTRVLKEMGLRDYRRQEVGGVALYPVEYFYPFPWHGQFSPDCVKESTYCVHHWEGSWWREEERRRRRSPRHILGRVLRALRS
ncbi:MAG TPA: glycosyltransferase [Pyrinomonadaceae bacterium]|jgi:mannosyltransferase OCH1-like enzyme